MKIISLFLLTLVVSCSANEIENKQSKNSFILNNVNIVDVENETIIPSKTIVIKNGKIDSITDQLPALLFPNLTVIDGKGGYVTPGLIDMHVHMYEKAAYILTLNHGVTHVRIMNGVPEQLVWRDNIQSGLQVGSTSTVSSPIISGNKEEVLQHGVETAEEARAAVKEYQSQGYDLIPHAAGDMPISGLIGLQSLEHVEDIYQVLLDYEFAPELLPKIAARLKASNVPITPTLNIFDQLTQLSHDKEDYLATTSEDYTSDIIALEASTNQVQRWLGASDKMAVHNQKTLKFLQYITKKLHESDIPLLIGSDSGVLLSPHGLATHNEMRLLAQAGLSVFDVLAAATINPAKALKLDQQIGKISSNYKADFIYSEANPTLDLSVLTEPTAVIKHGHWYSREVLNEMRDEAIASRSLWQEFFVLFEAL
jgi:hypothetical protein